MTNLALFDLDSTLIDSSALYFVGVPLVVEKHLNIKIEPSQFLDLWGQDAKRWLDRFARQEDRYSEEFVAEMYADFEQWYTENHADFVEHYNGVDEMLDEVRQSGNRIGIVTTRPQHRAELAYDLPWADYIDFVVGGDQVDNRKPAPDSIDYAVESQNGEQGSHFYLGDNDIDIFAARDSRYQVLGLAGLWGAENPDRLKASDPDCLFQTVAEFREWFSAGFRF